MCKNWWALSWKYDSTNNQKLKINQENFFFVFWNVKNKLKANTEQVNLYKSYIENY